MSAGGVRRITSSPSSQTSRRSSPAPCSSTSPASGTYQKPVQRALKNRRGRSGSSFRKSRVIASPMSSRSGVPLKPTSGNTCRRTPVRSAALELRKNNSDGQGRGCAEASPGQAEKPSADRAGEDGFLRARIERWKQASHQHSPRYSLPRWVSLTACAEHPCASIASTTCASVPPVRKPTYQTRSGLDSAINRSTDGTSEGPRNR